ncbi:MAG: insulinase family protein, partial [Acidobacteriota bacterium]
ASPDVVFNQAINAIVSRNSPRRQPETPAMVDQWNLAKSLAFYKARFADASQFRFVFVGSFTPDMIKPFVETYLASLPATPTHETWQDVGIAAPTGIIEKTIEKGLAPKSQVAILFTGPFQYDDAHRLALRTMTLVLQSRLSDTIRQELGGTYSITATADTTKFPRPEYRLRIEWTCDPARTAALVARVFEEIAFVKATAFSAGQQAVIRDILQREFETDSQNNGYLLGQIARRYEDGDGATIAAAVNVPGQIAALTGDQIVQAARTYLDLRNYVKVTLMPEVK